MPVTTRFTLLIAFSVIAATPFVAFAQTPPPSVHITGFGFAVGRFEDNVAAFSNKSWTWYRLPARFQNWDYTQTAIGQSVDLTVAADQDGMIYMATVPWLPATDLRGWTRVSDGYCTYEDPGHLDFQIFSMQCIAGEKVNLSFSRWNRGIVLAPHIDSPQAVQRQNLISAIYSCDIEKLNRIVTADANAVKDADASGIGVIQEDLRRSGTRLSEKNDKRETAAWLLDHGADPNMRPAGRSLFPLESAVEKGDPALVKLLLARGADPNLVGGDGRTAFDYILIYHGAYYMSPDDVGMMNTLFRLLTDRGNRIRFTPKQNESTLTPLISLILSRLASVESVKTLLSLGANIHERSNKASSRIDNYRMPSGTKSPPSQNWMLNVIDIDVLDAAVIARRDDLLQFFLSKGIDVNDRNLEGNTPLHYAVAQDVDVVSTLLAHHADPNAVNCFGYTPIQHNTSFWMLEKSNANRDNIRKVLKASDISRKNWRGQTALIGAIQEHDVEGLNDYLAFFKPVDKTEKLELAVARDDPDAISSLLTEIPALIRFRLSSGDTLLHTAARWHALKSITVLLKTGAEIDARNARGDTPLVLLMNSGSGHQIILTGKSSALLTQESADGDPDVASIVHLAEKLIDAGTSVNAQGNWEDVSPLSAAIDLRSPELVKYMLNHGADINLHAQEQNAPLTFAKSVGMVDLLLNAGADINAGMPNALMNALSNSNYEIATELIMRGADVNPTKTWGGETPLMRAAGLHATAIVKMLLERGAEVNAQYADQTALSMAGNNAEMISLLKAHGAKPQLPYSQPDVKHPDIYKISQDAVAASQNGSVAAMSHDVPIDSRDQLGRTALFYTKDPNALRLLVANGADPNAVDFNGNTPLHFAASPEACDALLAAGAKSVANNDGDLPINRIFIGMFGGAPKISQALIAASNLTLPSGSGLNALQQMLMTGNSECRQAMLSAKPKLDDYTIFLVAVSQNNGAVVHDILRMHPDYVSYRLSNGATALHISAIWNAQSAAAALLSAGADIEDRDSIGYTPLMWTMKSQHISSANRSFAKFLLSRHADPNARNQAGFFTLDQAVNIGDVSLVDQLLKYKADPKLRYSNGETVLHQFASRGRQSPDSALISLLLAYGADLESLGWPRIFDPSGLQTPLETALSAKNIEAANTLIKAGASVNTLTPDGITPLFVAVRSQNRDAVNMLLREGANVNAVNDAGETPLDWARRRYADFTIVAMLTAHGAHEGLGNDVGD